MLTESSKNSKNNSIRDQLRTRFKEDCFEQKIIAEYCVSRTGGVADFVVIARSTTDIIDAASLAVAANTPYFVIAGGTGMLVSDYGFPGIVIINQSPHISFVPNTSKIIVDSGVGNNTLLNTAASHQLGGIEFLAAIPGTIGGAVCTNAEWNGQSISRFVKEVLLLYFVDGKKVVASVSGAELGFESRSSIFVRNQTSHPPVVLNIQLQLAALPQSEIVRRLIPIRRMAEKGSLSRPCIGYVFKEPIHAIQLESLSKNGIRLIRRMKQDREVLESVGAARSREFRDAIHITSQQALEYGLHLEERISYLGYWPNDDESEGGAVSHVT